MINTQMTTKNSRFPFALLGSLLLAFVLRVYRLGEQSLWWDELYTVARSVMTVPELIENLFESRVHLPLYFLMIQVWSDLGRDAFILRYFSVIWGVIAVSLIFRVGRLLGGAKVGSLAAFLLAITPFHIWFSQETRMYSFLAVGALIVHYFLFQLLRHDLKYYWIGYTLSMIMTIYTHYLALLLLAAHYAFFSLHYRYHKTLFRKWLMYTGFVVASFAVWGIVIMLTGSFTRASISWIAPAHWYEPLLTLFSFSVGPSINPTQIIFYLPLIVYLVGFLLNLPALKMTQAAQSATVFSQVLSWRLVVAWLVVPLSLLCLISLDWPVPQKRSIYMDRYLISALPAFILLGAWGLARLEQKQRWLFLVGLVCIVIPIGLTLQNLYFNPLYAREDWRKAFNTLRTEWETGDVYLITPGQILPFFYYTDGTLPTVHLPLLIDLKNQEELFDETMQTIMVEASTQAQHAWLLTSFDNTNPHGFPQKRNTAVATIHEGSYQEWLDTHYPKLEEWTFTGIRLVLYRIDAETANSNSWPSNNQ